MKLLCIVILACVSLAGCAAGHSTQPEGDLTADRLLRVEDAISSHSESIVLLRDRLTDTRFGEIHDEIEKNHQMNREEFTKIGEKLDKLQESSQFPWWIAAIMGVGGPAGGYGAYRAGKSRTNGKEESA